jgi:uncharacterized protein (TIGR04255 family)
MVIENASHAMEAIRDNTHRRRHYSNPPIVEAVIEIRTADGISLKQCAQVADELSEEFPNRTEIVEVEAQLMTGSGSDAMAHQQTGIGFRLVSEKSRRVLAITTKHFAAGRLEPYANWESFSTDARRLWGVYAKVSDSPITRIGVRYVNRIEIPKPEFDVRDYLRTFPEISAGISQAVTGYFMQLQLPQLDIGATAVLHEALVSPPEAGGRCSIILDIDLSKEFANSSEDDAWAELDVLRDRKNEIFEGCITDEARALFDPEQGGI